MLGSVDAICAVKRLGKQSKGHVHGRPQPDPPREQKTKAEPDLPEFEYRFDRVPEQERKDCLNWEYEREFRRQENEPALKAWLELSEQEKKTSSQHMFEYVGRPEAVIVVSLDATKSRALVDPTKFAHAKIAKLPPMLVRWHRSDAEILAAFNRRISEWLKEQRKTDLSARQPHGQPYRSPRFLSLLVDLAIYRLRRANLAGPEIRRRLRAFDKLDCVSPSLISGKVFQGNLKRTCDRVKNFLFGKA